ncbi:MAG: hypothetical protein CBC42_07795 [Betaproteobacteria bacterium TMED82]|nr:MAG: hypothetical protein CBC42_07795 [Betaproteobacteria bacterium TMED82]|tara:strand:+ start:20063 stop:20443 length:381 start_codon:yes stop_codon:yes gene_type:complete
MQHKKRQALILIAHGSKDPEWSSPFQTITNNVKKNWLKGPVELAFFELQKPLLETVIQMLIDSGYKCIHVEPLLLANGFHLKNDLPKRVKNIISMHEGLNLTFGKPLINHKNIQRSICEVILNPSN